MDVEFVLIYRPHPVHSDSKITILTFYLHVSNVNYDKLDDKNAVFLRAEIK